MYKEGIWHLIKLGKRTSARNCFLCVLARIYMWKYCNKKCFSFYSFYLPTSNIYSKTSHISCRYVYSCGPSDCFYLLKSLSIFLWTYWMVLFIGIFIITKQYLLERTDQGKSWHAVFFINFFMNKENHNFYNYGANHKLLFFIFPVKIIALK